MRKQVARHPPAFGGSLLTTKYNELNYADTQAVFFIFWMGGNLY